mmetsp:Transcript_58658/g.156165  ORF Transcript_58658/g.156165 Transcript_58658/m.156165 type:complete len:118 (+) Transcript_58658:657-1010(+)
MDTHAASDNAGKAQPPCMSTPQVLQHTAPHREPWKVEKQRGQDWWSAVDVTGDVPGEEVATGFCSETRRRWITAKSAVALEAGPLSHLAPSAVSRALFAGGSATALTEQRFPLWVLC